MKQDFNDVRIQITYKYLQIKYDNRYKMTIIFHAI